MCIECIEQITCMLKSIASVPSYGSDSPPFPWLSIEKTARERPDLDNVILHRVLGDKGPNSTSASVSNDFPLTLTSITESASFVESDGLGRFDGKMAFDVEVLVGFPFHPRCDATALVDQHASTVRL